MNFMEVNFSFLSSLSRSCNCSSFPCPIMDEECLWSENFHLNNFCLCFLCVYKFCPTGGMSRYNSSVRTFISFRCNDDAGASCVSRERERKKKKTWKIWLMDCKNAIDKLEKIWIITCLINLLDAAEGYRR